MQLPSLVRTNNQPLYGVPYSFLDCDNIWSVVLTGPKSIYSLCWLSYFDTAPTLVRDVLGGSSPQCLFFPVAIPIRAGCANLPFVFLLERHYAAEQFRKLFLCVNFIHLHYPLFFSSCSLCSGFSLCLWCSACSSETSPFPTHEYM